MQTDKPGSVLQFYNYNACHLSMRPTLLVFQPRLESGEPPGGQGLHGLTTHKVFSTIASLQKAWAFTPRFHLFPSFFRNQGSYFL